MASHYSTHRDACELRPGAGGDPISEQALVGHWCVVCLLAAQPCAPVSDGGTAR